MERVTVAPRYQHPTAPSLREARSLDVIPIPANNECAAPTRALMLAVRMPHSVPHLLVYLEEQRDGALDRVAFNARRARGCRSAPFACVSSPAVSLRLCRRHSSNRAAPRANVHVIGCFVHPVSSPALSAVSRVTLVPERSYDAVGAPKRAQAVFHTAPRPNTKVRHTRDRRLRAPIPSGGGRR